MKKILWNALRAAAGIAIIIILIFKVNITKLLGLFSIMILKNYIYLIFVVALLLILYCIEVFNIKILTDTTKNKIKYSKLFKLHMLSWSIGLFIPGRIGQISLIYFMKKNGARLGDASAIVIVDKMITLLSVFIVSIFGFWFLLPDKNDALKAIFFIILLAVGMYLLIINRWGREMFKKYVLRGFSEKFSGFSNALRKFYKFNKKILLLNSSLTIVKFFISSLILLCFFIALGFHVSVWHIFIINTMLIIASFIPLTPNGMGIRESTAVYLYGLIGVSSIAVVGVYLLNIILNYLTAFISLTLFFDELDMKKNLSKIKEYQKPSINRLVTFLL